MYYAKQGICFSAINISDVGSTYTHKSFVSQMAAFTWSQASKNKGKSNYDNVAISLYNLEF